MFFFRDDSSDIPNGQKKSMTQMFPQSFSREDDYFTKFNLTSQKKSSDQASWFWSKLMPFSVLFWTTFVTLNYYQLVIYRSVVRTKKMMYCNFVFLCM